MRRIGLFCLLFLFIGLQLFAQSGSFLIVGGGSEKNNPNGWSTPAYKLAAEGKRVAVIGTSTGSLAPYLTRYCGASYAKEFAVASRDSADSQILYDSLMTYQMIFFRGGDQYDYYRYYRNTKLQEAVEVIYSQGGTIGGTSAGMHILSSVIFTAKNGTVYPYEAIENPHNRYMTLADDFFDFFPGHFFDTHFSERSRFARLAGFLAKYNFDNEVNLIGIGMDDMSCMFVDSNNIGTVYGTGCANIYSFEQDFQLNGNKLLQPEMKLTQLIQGCTYDFNTAEMTMAPMEHQLVTDTLEESGNYTVLASGGNLLIHNHGMLEDLVNSCGEPSDAILLLTNNQNLAQSFTTKLNQIGSGDVDVFEMKVSNGSNQLLAEKIKKAKKILFLDNSSLDLKGFLNTSNGNLLSERLQTAGIIAAFVGDDARFAGKTIVDNYYDYLASWYAEMTFSPGLGMLRHSVIMPNTYFNSDMYENAATAVPYAMSIDTLRYGIWLTSKSYMKMMPVDQKTTLFGYGLHPLMILRNEGGLTDLVTQSGTGTNNATPRMTAGFSNLTFSMVDYTIPYIMGNTESLSVDEVDAHAKINIIGNPVEERLQVQTTLRAFDWTITDTYGRIVMQGFEESNTLALTLPMLQSGIYILGVKEEFSTRYVFKKFVKL